ncbi:MAG: type II secretion system protein GspG [Acidobacteria bacterium]|nr:MAG: type II secretion system protein GspG [Acidobacteriota bacterium]PYS09724.1 MAG: type II secretion system protein GspG [Acidobacteriota bacterium]
MDRKKNHSGITLIELLVVMVIIAMFATIVGQRLFRNVEKARQTTAKAQISEFESVLDAFRLDVGRYPTNEEGLQSLRVRPGSLERWDGPYLRKDVPLDPWQRAYVYRFPGQHSDYDLYSLGADGQEGGEGEDADVTNWK